MPNLYKIKMGHAAPKDWVVATITHVLANNDEEVYDWIASEPNINGKQIFNSWKDNVEDYEGNNDEEWDDSEYKDFKSKMLAIKGEIHDEDYDFTDSYYGITLYGWELHTENIESGLEKAIELGIVVKI